MKRLCLIAVVTLCAAASARPVAAAENTAQERAALTSQYGAKLAELATWCDGEKLVDEAARTRAWLPERDPFTLYLVVLNDSLSAGPAADASAAVQEWHRRFRELRNARAESLFALAAKAVRNRQATLGYELVLEAARENPDHEKARRMLGYQRHEGRWLTPYEIDKAKTKQVWHPKFGWLREDRVERYEKGERFVKSRWIAAEEDARLSSDINRGWDIHTEHFSIRTNHSLEEGARLAGKLEELYRVWQQVFVLFYATEAQLTRWFQDGHAESRMPRRSSVVYFRTRDEYNAALIKTQPNIGISTGYYDGIARKSYFFAGPDADDVNIFHEATHQLFNESRQGRGPIGSQDNFWIVEGIACYMESLQQRDGYYLLGGRKAIRLLDAKYRLDEGFYVPLGELVGLGMAELQRDERIARLYSESSGLTHFLMHGQDGKYRDALVDYLIAIYAGRDSATTLAELTGASYAELDKQYREFIASLAANP